MQEILLTIMLVFSNGSFGTMTVSGYNWSMSLCQAEAKRITQIYSRRSYIQAVDAKCKWSQYRYKI